MLQAHRIGRVDAFVQSTDKNFLVPVGGAVVASSSEAFIQDVAQIYPGQIWILLLFCLYTITYTIPRILTNNILLVYY